MQVFGGIFQPIEYLRPCSFLKSSKPILENYIRNKVGLDNLES